MKTINSKPPHPSIGRKVILKKEYKSGNQHFCIGETGRIIGITKHNLPDFGLFDFSVYEIEFSGGKVSWGQGIVEEFLNVL